MSAKMHELTFDGGLLERGFWLYVWEITTPEQKTCYYVGRTGDSSSFNAQSVFNRMGQHLGSRVQSNTLRRHLKNKVIDPQECSFRLVAYAPVMGDKAHGTSIVNGGIRLPPSRKLLRTRCVRRGMTC
jgi:hypothetical protein